MCTRVLCTRKWTLGWQVRCQALRTKGDILMDFCFFIQKFSQKTEFRRLDNNQIQTWAVPALVFQLDGGKVVMLVIVKMWKVRNIVNRQEPYIDENALDKKVCLKNLFVKAKYFSFLIFSLTYQYSFLATLSL